MSIIESLIVLPLQSLSYLENKIRATYPLLNKVKQTPLMTTEQYEAIYPNVAHILYQELKFTPYDSLLVHIEDNEDNEDMEYIANGVELDGFYILDHNGKTHVFVFTYEGKWLYNNQPLITPIHIQEYINRLVCNSYECLIYNNSLTKEKLNMDNIERLQMEITGLDLPHEELFIYLEEEGIEGYTIYNASSKANKRAIYASALSILNSLANQPHLMKNYKQDDMTVEGFHKMLQSRIKQLQLTIHHMPNEDSTPSNFFNLFI